MRDIFTIIILLKDEGVRDFKIEGIKKMKKVGIVYYSVFER